MKGAYVRLAGQLFGRESSPLGPGMVIGSQLICVLSSRLLFRIDTDIDTRFQAVARLIVFGS